MANPVGDEVLIKSEVVISRHSRKPPTRLFGGARLNVESSLDQKPIREVVANGVTCLEVLDQPQPHTRRLGGYRRRGDEARRAFNVSLCVRVCKCDGSAARNQLLV